MEYILNIEKVSPLTEEEKKEKSQQRLYKGGYDESYASGVGRAPDTKTVHVLSVVLTEEEYKRAKHAIIETKE